MELLDILLILLVTIFLPLWWRRIGKGSRNNLPPGPSRWPIVGNLFQVIRPFMYVVRDLRKEYGPIFTMQMGQRTLIILTDANLIHEALVQRGALFASRPAESPTRLVFSLGKCAINSAEYGSLWRALRKNFATEVVGSARVKQCGWVRKWAMENHMGRIKEEAHEKGYVEVMSQCRLTICSIIICLCFGAKLSEELIKNIESVLKEVMLMTLPKLPDFLPVLIPLVARGQLRQAKALRKKQMEVLGPLVQARKGFVESGGSPKSSSFDMASPVGAAYVDSLLSLDPPERPGGLGEEELVTLCSEVINAGTDTSATVIEWALLHLVLDQKVQQKLYEEIVDVIGYNGVVSEDDLEKMVYLNAFIKETLRRHPPSHFLLSHAAREDAVLGGYTIPKDANLEIYTAWVTQDPTLWPDPESFRPERFMPGGEGYEVDWTGNRGVRMLPFGAGRRICPAWSLGTLHVGLMLARMVHAFRWVPNPGSPPDATETFAFTMVMKNPLKAVIFPRC
ncbi:cytochrome P450 77A4-like [Chenopodium quinoa]|uniref:cytochrome P450 77A4-like n=1 Tax=Chenopodium quinoa TaxID=63459 RepID=UPI000B77BC30|nr:cytochrome P450 77A4-like [Chenopodium quinoa]